MDMFLTVLMFMFVPAVGIAVLFCGFRIAIGAFEKILKKHDSLAEFKPWRVWVGWIIYFTLCFWSVMAAVVAGIGTVHLFIWISQ